LFFGGAMEAILGAEIRLDLSTVRQPTRFRAAEKQKDKSGGLSYYKQVTSTGFEPFDFFHRLS